MHGFFSSHTRSKTGCMVAYLGYRTNMFAKKLPYSFVLTYKQVSHMYLLTHLILCKQGRQRVISKS